jgi:hypothetical protein
MMRTASEKLAIIRLVEDSELSVRWTLDEIKVSRTGFYRWYGAYAKGGLGGLANQGRVSRRHWNRIPDSVSKAAQSTFLVSTIPAIETGATDLDLIQRPTDRQF